METLMWIFNNVMPWLGVYFTITAIAFLIILVVFVFQIGIKYISSHLNIMNKAQDASIIANAIPLLFIKLISWLGEKIIIKWIDAKRERARIRCKEGTCDGSLETEIKVTLNFGYGDRNFKALFCKNCRRLHHLTGELLHNPSTEVKGEPYLHEYGPTIVYKIKEEQN